MKKIMIFIGFFLFFVPIVKAENYLSFDKPIIEYPEIDGYGLQGFTTVNNYLFIVMVGHDDSSSIIIVYDLENNKLIKKYSFDSVGHANDVTYNKDNNKIYVLEAGGYNGVYIFDGTTFMFDEKIELELPARSITYIEDKQQYAIRTVSTGFKLDSDLKLKNKIPFIIGMNARYDIGRQGWTYYDGFIYYTNWSWIRFGGDGRNMIFVYDLKGNHIDDFYTNNDIGEIEDIAFYNNKMILGFNAYDSNTRFYMLDIPDIKKKEVLLEPQDALIIDSHNSKDDFKYIFIGISIMILLLIFLFILKKKKSIS